MTVSKTIQYSKVESILYRIDELEINKAIILLLKEKFPEDHIEWLHQSWLFEHCENDNGKVYCEATRRVTEPINEEKPRPA
jgi:predicted subunit of tRNA(5-methylaminomethyl-2-thiouridylate) methyltransferase